MACDPIREVRLRPAFADLYPGVPADQWLEARASAELLVGRARWARAENRQQRTFDPRHFEFRGGRPPRAPGERHLHSRAVDR